MPTLDPGYRYALVKYAGDGIRTDWQIAFDGGYLSQEDVYAYSYVTADRSDRQEHTLTFISESADEATVRISPAVALGRTVVIARLTQRGAPLVDFINRSMLTEKNLNTVTQQAIYSVAEIQDAFQELYEDNAADIGGILADVLSANQTAAAAQTTAAGAVATANSAAAAAASATATANAASAKGDQAIQKANDTQAAADAATAAAQDATDAANAANALVQNIQAEVDSAVDTANAASEQANAAANTALALSDQIDQANATATEAKNTADAIDAKATQAQADSAAAQDAASQASTDAAAATAAAANAAPTTDPSFSGTVVFEMDTTVRLAGWGGVPTNGALFFGTGNSYIVKSAGGWTLHNDEQGVGGAGDYNLTVPGTVWTSGNFNPATKADKSLANGATLASWAAGAFITSGPGGGSVRIGTSTAGGALVQFTLPDGTVEAQIDNDGSYSTGGSVTGGDIIATSGHLYSNAVNVNVSFVTGKSGTIYFRPNGNGTATGQTTIATSGAMSIGGSCTATGGFQSGSSIKLKHQLRPSGHGLASLRKLRVMTGRYRKWFTGDTRRRVFLIAEDIKQHIPEAFAPAVYTVEKGPHKGSYDGYQPEQIIAVLVKAVQELADELDKIKESRNG